MRRRSYFHISASLPEHASDKERAKGGLPDKRAVVGAHGMSRLGHLPLERYKRSMILLVTTLSCQLFIGHTVSITGFNLAAQGIHREVLFKIVSVWA